MVAAQQECVVGKCSNRQVAEDAFTDLYDCGFSINRIAIVAKDADYQARLNGGGTIAPAGDKAHEKTAPCATITGSILGAIGGSLIGLGLLAIPAVGAALAIGTVEAALATTLAGAAIGIVGGGLTSCVGSRLCADGSLVDSDRLLPDEYLIVVDGTDEQLHRAEFILAKYSSRDALVRYKVAHLNPKAGMTEVGARGWGLGARD